MSIRKPKVKFVDLPKEGRRLVLEIIRGFLRESQAHTDFGFEGTEEAMIELLNLGLLRLVDTGAGGVGLSLYDWTTKTYNPLGVKNNNESTDI